MKYKLIKELNGYSIGTIVSVVMRGTDGYEIKEDKTEKHIGFIKYEQKREYITN